MAEPALMMGFMGTSPHDPNLRKLLRQIKNGLVQGVILFKYNIQDAIQLKELTSALWEAAGKGPFWMALDQEGGKVQRLPFSHYVSAAEVARTLSSRDAETYYDGMAEELASFGINMNFGPVVDLAAPGSIISKFERAYGTTPEAVIPYAQAFVNGHQNHHITPCLKHFPGHGLAQGDTHEGFVDITKTHQTAEMLPFQQVDCPAVMVAHLMHKKWDKKWPTSLSPVAIQKKLREDLGFQGMVISDDYVMGAIQQHYRLRDVVRQAYKAGIDVMIFSNNPAAAPKNPNYEPNVDLPELVLDILMKAQKHA